MRRLLSLIMSIIMVFSLSGCCSPEKQENLAKYEKYKDLIALLEKEDYTAAIADIEARIPASTFTEIKITEENYREYFTVVLEENWHSNAFGEADDLLFSYVLKIKDKYLDRLTNLDNTEIALEWTSKAAYYICEYNLKNKTYTLGIPVAISNENENIIENTTCSGLVMVNSGYNGALMAQGGLLNGRNVVSIPEDFELLRIQGSIFLTNE